MTRSDTTLPPSTPPLAAIRQQLMEEASRREVRRSLAAWARHREFVPARHHDLFIAEIEAFLSGDDDILVLASPPGSAKSTYVSELLPAWYLANNPTHALLFATHSIEFSERWG